MKKKPESIKNNPVAKHAPEFCKPKTFRDRKKHPSAKEEKWEHDRAVPYDRNKIVEDEQDYGGDWDDEDTIIFHD